MDFEVSITAPGNIFALARRVDSSLETVVTLGANDIPGKGISVLIFYAAFGNTFFCSMLMQ